MRRGDPVGGRCGDRGVQDRRAHALGRVAPGGRPAAGAAGDSAGRDAGDGDAGQGAVAVLPDPVPWDAGRVLARWGLPGQGAAPVFAPGARYPLVGLLLALPALEGSALLDAAREVCGQLKDGFYGLTATLLTLVFLALAGELRAEGATRVPPAALGRGAGPGPGAGGQDDPPQAGRARRRGQGSRADHGASPPPRRRPARCAWVLVYRRARPGRLRDPAGAVDPFDAAVVPRPATMETWVTGQDGDPVFMAVTQPSDSLAGELRRLLPQPRQVVGAGRRVTVCFDRGGRLVASAVLRHHRGLVRPAHLAQGPGSRRSRRRVHHGGLHRRPGPPPSGPCAAPR
jgi:hypothetical protein